MQVLKELHPDLQLKVVKAAVSSGCRLAHLQSRLVSELQPLALESLVKDGDTLDLSDEVVCSSTPGPTVCRPPAGLENMTHLQFLSLANSDGASGDPQRLSSTLSKLVNLTHLDLHSNMLQSAACEPLAVALKCMPCLAHLDLSSNVLRLGGLEALSRAIPELTEITHLSLAENSIVAGTTPLKRILAALPKLSQLALDHNAILRPTASLPEESAPPSTDDQHSVYSSMGALASLKLSNNCLSNSDVDEFVRPLIDAYISTLTALDLSDNSLSTKAVPAMCKIVASCTNLRSLDISSCAFSCNEIAEIVSAIPDQPTPSERTCEARANMQPAPLLESLALREMDPFPMEPDEDSDALPTALQRFVNLNTLDISSLELPAHTMEELPVGSFTGLTMLDVSMNCVLQQSPLGMQLSSLMQLQCLNVNSLFLPDDVLLSFAAALSSLTALSVLDMGNNAIASGPACSELVTALATLPALQSLELSDNYLLDEGSALVAALPRMSTLRELSLQNNELHDDTVGPLACALGQLPLLMDLSIASICVGSSAGTPPALRLCSTLTALTNLTSLCISGNGFHSPDASALADILSPLSKLCHLEMGMLGLPPAHLGCTASTLAQISCLSSLDLSNNSMRLEGAKQLAPHLARMTWIRDLDLSSTMLSPAGLHMIGDSLRPLTALRAVRLDDVVGSGSAPEAWGRVFAALAGIAGLRELELRYNRFPSSCIAEHIAPHMSGLTALESLDLQDCEMSRVCSRVLSPCILGMCKSINFVFVQYLKLGRVELISKWCWISFPSSRKLSYLWPKTPCCTPGPSTAHARCRTCPAAEVYYTRIGSNKGKTQSTKLLR